MDELHAVVRNPVGGLLDTTVFLGVLLVAVFGFVARSRVVRAVVVLAVVGVVWYREQGLYILMRLSTEHPVLTQYDSRSFFAGMRLVAKYAMATELYSVGCATILGALAIFGYRDRK